MPIGPSGGLLRYRTHSVRRHTLGAATDAFEADEVLTKTLGSALAATIVDLRRAEVARFRGCLAGEDRYRGAPEVLNGAAGADAVGGCGP